MYYRIIFCLVAIVLLVGTASADTLILYVDNTSQDGSLNELTDATWQTLRDAPGDSVSYSSTDNNAPYLLATSTENIFSARQRGAIIFNASKAGSGITIDSIVMSIFIYQKTTGLGKMNMSFTQFSPYSNTIISTSDYNSFSNTRIANDLLYDSISTTAYSNITFTDTSGFNISGFFPIMIRDNCDVDNTPCNSWVSSAFSRLRWYEVSNPGTASDPFLTITYHTTGDSPPVASFTLNKNYIRIPNAITATDTSTNTPTSWQWSWGDGTANSTTQNPTHQYLKRGKFDIYLTATNAGGSGSTGATSIKVYGYEN
jgi:hypothetical protein